MINHARTLLLNQSSSTAPDSYYPGEEYVPIGFAKQNLPHTLSTIWNLLFGIQSDRALINYRLRQYLALLHTTELSSYIYDLDSRVTYWPLKDDLLFKQATFGAVIATLTTSAGWDIAIIGPVNSLTSANQLYSSWEVQILANNQVSIVNLLQPSLLTVTSTFTVSGNYSSQVPIPGSSLSLQFNIGQTPLPTWIVSTLARPVLELSDIYELVLQSDYLLPELFAGSKEPYLTCRSIWDQPDVSILYKLSAVILALIYKLNDLNTGAV